MDQLIAKAKAQNLLQQPVHMAPEEIAAKVRQFESGATRNLDTNKLDFSGFLNPIVLERYAEYMHRHRFLEDGSLRDSDNWQKGIPKSSCIQSAWRHFHDWWKADRGYISRDDIEEAICALMFNAQAYLLQLLRERGYQTDKVWIGANQAKEAK